MKPDNIPQDVWEAAMPVAVEMEMQAACRTTTVAKADAIARAILAEREWCATVADSEALSHRNRQTEAATAHDEESHLLHALLAQQSEKIAAAIRKGGE